MTAHPVLPTEIEALAHTFWEEAGRTDGHALEDWLKAERQLRSERAHAALVESSLAPEPAAAVDRRRVKS